MKITDIKNLKEAEDVFERILSQLDSIGLPVYKVQTYMDNNSVQRVNIVLFDGKIGGGR